MIRTGLGWVCWLREVGSEVIDTKLRKHARRTLADILKLKPRQRMQVALKEEIQGAKPKPDYAD